MSRQVTYRVHAIGSTDAADQAKRRAREAGLRVQTVASIRLTTPGHKHGFDPSRQSASWTVTLAVRASEDA